MSTAMGFGATPATREVYSRRLGPRWRGLRVFLGMCAAVMVVSPTALTGGHGAGPSAGKAGSGARAHLVTAALPGTGGNPLSVSVLPNSVTAGSVNTFTITFTTASSLVRSTVGLVVPTGWTSPSETPGSPGYVRPECLNRTSCPNMRVVSRTTVEFTGFSLDSGQSFNVTYADARAPDEATTAAFQALYAYDAAWLGSSPPPPPVAYVTVRWPDGTGSMSVSPRSAAAGSARTFTFTYTAAGYGILPGGQLSLVIPPGWTPPSLTGPAGYITASVFGPPSISGRTITVRLSQRGDQLAPGATLAITYATASAPSSPGTFTFSASQQTAESGALTPLAESPQVTLAPAVANGGGTSGAEPGGRPSATTTAETGRITVAPDTVTAGQSAVLTFTYTAGAAGLRRKGEVELTVPPGWPAPPSDLAAAGHPTTSAGTATVSGRRVTISQAKLEPGQQLIITYRTQAVPRSPGRFTFAARERFSGTSRLTALAISPSVTVAGSPGSVPPVVIWLLAALVALAAGATLAIRRLRSRPGPALSVRAEPHTGPPALVTIRDTGEDPALAVRIEPHPGAPSTILEEARP